MDTQYAGGERSIGYDASPLVVDDPAFVGRQRLRDLRPAAPLVLPSLLLCDFGHLADEVRRVEVAGVSALHLDVMDGHFVPNSTYGLTIVEAVRRLTSLPIDAHLMVTNPLDTAEQFVRAGADSVTFHIEAEPDPAPLIDRLHEMGAGVGLALNPPTPLAAVLPFVDRCDLVLVMSVCPGYGGQAFEPVALKKLSELSARVGEGTLLQVDGGVNASTIGRCAEAGSQLHVVGSAIFSTDDYDRAVATLTHLAKTHARKQ